MYTALILMTSLVVLVVLLWLLTREIVQDRPYRLPSSSASQDWREQELAWHRLGIR